MSEDSEDETNLPHQDYENVILSTIRLTTEKDKLTRMYVFLDIKIDVLECSTNGYTAAVIENKTHAFGLVKQVVSSFFPLYLWLV